jgi:hypothetical protein
LVGSFVAAGGRLAVGVVDSFAAEGGNLVVEGGSLAVEEDNLAVEGDNLAVEGDNLAVEGDNLAAEGGMVAGEAGKLVGGDRGWMGGRTRLQLVAGAVAQRTAATTHRFFYLLHFTPLIKVLKFYLLFSP